jgi:hypothetical protein|tara:strand:- start:877 stop:1083 length:207 start_codon:yes stop_codon:yes gene_type:complete
MIIYGNSGQDIRRMIWRRKYRIMSVIAGIVIAVMLLGCGTAENRKIELKALDKFWKTLGSGKNSTGVE